MKFCETVISENKLKILNHKADVPVESHDKRITKTKEVQKRMLLEKLHQSMKVSSF